MTESKGAPPDPPHFAPLRGDEGCYNLPMSTDCLFCRIGRKELPATILHEDAEVVAFRDIHPQAPTHLLFVPKEHVESVLTLDEGTKGIPGMLIWKAKQFAESKKIPGYKLTFHCGKAGGQIVDHIHLHLIAQMEIGN